MNDEMMLKMNSSISCQAFSGNAYSQGHRIGAGQYSQKPHLIEQRIIFIPIGENN